MHYHLINGIDPYCHAVLDNEDLRKDETKVPLYECPVNYRVVMDRGYL